MIYFVYATLTGWLIMVLVNYHSHKKYITHNRDRFLKILDENYSAKGKIKEDDNFYFSFSPDQIENREFSKYLNLGKIKYILSDTTQIVFSLLLIFIISFWLEYLPFVNNDSSVIDFHYIFKFLLIGYVICLFDAYSKTKKYDMIIKFWKEKNSGKL